MERLNVQFYERADPVLIAQELLGKRLLTEWAGQRCVGRIVETEAYWAPDDKACHAYLNRYTKRTETMFEAGGVAYIYLCYGIHHLFNIVTGPAGMAHVVLVRAVEPLEGHEYMLQRRKMGALKPQLTAGPGVMSQAMGLHKGHNGISLIDPLSPVWLEDDGFDARSLMLSGPRIGVESAGECAAWPWRFWIRDNAWVSQLKKRHI